MDNLDLVPVGLVDCPVQLAAAVRANCDDKGRSADFLAKMDGRGPIEFLRAVDCDAVADGFELAHQHCHLGRVGAEMRMDMIYPLPHEPRRDPACLGKIGEMPDCRTVR